MKKATFILISILTASFGLVYTSAAVSGASGMPSQTAELKI
jgi:hypothetical protein